MKPLAYRGIRIDPSYIKELEAGKHPAAATWASHAAIGEMLENFCHYCFLRLWGRPGCKAKGFDPVGISEALVKAQVAEQDAVIQALRDGKTVHLSLTFTIDE